jgi:3-dehydroquinate dehydratase
MAKNQENKEAVDESIVVPPGGYFYFSCHLEDDIHQVDIYANMEV